MPNLSPDDRDAVARTILSETGSRSSPGMAAVAHVIRNRTESGGYGDSPRAVVMSRGQFEPWSLPRSNPNHPLNHDARGPEYQKAAAITDAVFSDRIPDMTRGSEYFYDPAVQSALGRKVPKWAQGEPAASVGGHLFFPAPGKQPTASDPLSAISAAIGESPIKTGAMAYDGEGSKPAEPSMFEAAGFKVPKAAPVPAASTGSIFSDAGFTLPGKAATAAVAPPAAPLPPGAAGLIQVPGGGSSAVDASGNFLDVPRAPQPSFFERAHQAIWLPSPAEFGGAITEARQGAEATLSQGLADVRHGLSATGVGETALGALGVAASPITGIIHQLVGKPAAKIGGETFGQRADLLAGLLVPGGTGAKIAKEALPSTKAVNALVDAIGPENVPAAVARLRANPQLSPVDISDPVRTMAQGLIDPAQPRTQDVVVSAVKRRMAEAPGAVNSAYTAALGPAPDTGVLLQGLKDRSRRIGQTEIQPALANAKPVDTAPVVKAIDEIVKPGLTAMLDPGTRLPLSPVQQELLRLKQQLVAPTGETLVDAQRLHDVQSRVGDYAYQLSKSADGKDRFLGKQLRDMNEKLIDQIDTASGGKYRPARAKFAESKDIHQSFEDGFDVLKNRSGVAGLEDRPEALAKWMKTATPEEVYAKQLGVRSDIDQKIRGVRNQVQAGTGITKIEYNREKLEALFGKQESGRLVRAMEDAADMSQTNAKLIAGSKTAETLAGQRALEVPKVGGGNPLQLLGPVLGEMGAAALGQSPGLATAMLGAAKGAHMGWQKVSQMNALARNAAFARGAVASGPAREELINRLATHPKVLRLTQKPGNALAVFARP